MTDTSEFKYYERDLGGNIQIKNFIWSFFVIYLIVKFCLTVFLNSQPQKNLEVQKNQLIGQNIVLITAPFIHPKVRHIKII